MSQSASTLVIMSCHVMSCHVMSGHIMSCHVRSYNVMSYHVMLSYAKQCHEIVKLSALLRYSTRARASGSAKEEEDGDA